MQTVTTIHDARQAILPWRKLGETVTLVPTMGSLHRGHMSLVERARQISSRVITSIFVNPLQFSANEDLEKYPRQMEADQAMLRNAGCDLVFAPQPDEIYPDGFASAIDPGPLGLIWEGAVRPGHFRGVATVVAKLFMQMMPNAALFGEKDYQQVQVIRRMTQDFDIPVQIIPMPIIRDPDGLALSSRNVYLSADERHRALTLPRSLFNAAEALNKNADIDTTLVGARAALTKAGFVADYFELVDAENLQPVRDLSLPRRLLAAGKMGTTRLLDNIEVSPKHEAA
jgi:pantoate--beta-alanine ligase